VLVPIHIKGADPRSDHWIMVAIKLDEQQILVADSTQKAISHYYQYTDVLCEWLNALHRGEHDAELRASREWVCLVQNMPQQTDGVQCGMFALCAARHFVLGSALVLTNELAAGNGRYVVAIELMGA